MRRRSFLATSGLVVFCTASAKATFAQAATVSGAGASFPNAVYGRWAQLALGPLGVQVKYEPSGSSAGADRVAAREVDFAGTDNPKRPGALREQSLIQFPSVMGAVVPYVNLPGVRPGQFRLTGELLADLFLGKIEKWNDKRIAAENAGLSLPDLPVTPVHRAGASGTNFIFTTYLTRVSEAWAAGPRASNIVRWPAGHSADGNKAMAEKVKGTPGAVSYTEASFAAAEQLATVSLKNRPGGFVAPDAASFGKAAEAGDWSSPGFVTEMIDLDGAGVWPIVSPTFILMPANPEADKVAASLNALRFFDWAFQNAGEATTGLGFIPLPPSLHDPIRAVWRRVKGPDGKPIWEA